MRKLNQIPAVMLFMILTAFFLVPFAVHADEKNKTIRVGWHDAPYFMKDQDGRRSGYSYEYQWKVAAYTGWDYEYVEGTWPELLQKLKDGEIA